MSAWHRDRFLGLGMVMQMESEAPPRIEPSVKVVD
jgi:hypothetical protein